MIVAILAAWFGYKKAKATGRNGILWAVIAASVFIGIQLIIGFFAGTLIALGIEFWGWPENFYERYDLLISVAGMVISTIGLLLVFRYLDRVPGRAMPYNPPPPPNFEN